MAIEKVNQEKKMSLLQKAVDAVLKRIRMLFMECKFFYGTYADNQIEAQKFINGSDRVVLHYHSSLLKFQYEKPEGDAAFISALIDEQIRIQRREFRKQQKAMLFYYNDNLITRALGFKKGIAHYRFTGENIPIPPVEKLKSLTTKLKKAQSDLARTQLKSNGEFQKN